MSYGQMGAVGGFGGGSGSVGDPWAGLDGRAGAPAGVAQLPSLLNGYPSASPPNARVRWPAQGTQPPWMVAGVDYAVGPRSTPLLDPTTSPPAGCSFATNTLRVNADNVSIQGYDFSLHGGVNIYCPSNNNLTIVDCKFGGTNYPALSTGPIDFRGVNLIVQYCTIDGGSVGGAESQATLLYLGSTFSGSFIFQYNWCKNYCQQIVELLSGAGLSFTIDYRYNLIDDTTIETGGHQNYLQLTAGTASSVTVQFNTTRQVTVGGAEGFQFYFNVSGTINSPNLSYNTMIALNSGVMSNMVHGSTMAGTTVTGNPIASQNYFDPTGATHCFYPTSFTGWAFSGNLNMTNGTAVSDGTTP